MSESEQITGRRLDVNDGTNLVLFCGTDPKLYGNPKRIPADNDMLDYVRAQEQRLKLEKLKWHQTNAEVIATKEKPAATSSKSTISKPIKPNPIIEKKQVKDVPNPKHVAELVENRNKKALLWLHQEQKGVSCYSKSLNGIVIIVYIAFTYAFLACVIRTLPRRRRL